LPELSGTVSLARVVYARHVQLPEAVFAIGSDRMRATRSPVLALDLRLASQKPLAVRNSFLDVELELGGKERSLRVLGTDAQPAVVGELSVLRGRANFRGSDLSVRRAKVLFEDEERIAPKLDLYAEAPASRRKGATIALEAKGSPDRFRLGLRCVAPDGRAVPAPFACGYEGDAVRCDDFARLTTLWACQAPEAQ
jgi:autotransporter translocation and assembly factor TamB